MALSAALDLDLAPAHRPVEIEATLRSGVGMDPPYALDLAGLLAARMRRVEQAALDEAGRLFTHPLPDTTGDEPLDMDLPLGRCRTGSQWHWLASCALPVHASEHPDPRIFYRTVDSAWAQRAADRPLPYFHPTGGAYRDVMVPSPVLTCTALRWHAVGDPVAIAALLAPLRFIGRRRTTGEGSVLSWRVTEVDTDPGTWAHLSAGEIARPCPPECAEALGVPYRTGWFAIRPPSHHPDLLALLAMAPQPEEDW